MPDPLNVVVDILRGSRHEPSNLRLRHLVSDAGLPSAIISIRLWGGGLDASPQISH
jgi:hypothetical protein